MATTPEIKTKFTLDGLRQAVTGLRGFARTVSDTLGDARRRGGKVFDPMGRGLDSIERKTKTVAKELTKLGAAGTFRGIRVGAMGASVAVGGLAAKMSAVSAAAVKAAKDSAASLKSISIDAQRIGGSTTDIAVLGYAADATGTDRDELVTQIATISNEFLTLRDNIQKAHYEYRDFLASSYDEARLLAKVGQRDQFGELLGGFKDAKTEALRGSIADIEQRIALIDSALDQGLASSNVGGHLTTAYDNLDQNEIGPSGPVYGKQKGRDGRLARMELEKELRELTRARDEFWAAQSPQAQALRELEQYGIDVDRASRGGVDGLLEIADAFQHIQDPSQRARVAMRLFGEDAGVKLIPLLNGGRQAIDEYRRTVEKSGGIASEQDIANAERYSRAVLNLKTATSGLELTIGRALTPDLTRISEELTAHIIKHREQITKHALEAFKGTEVFANDIVGLFGGNTADIQTGWLDVVVKKTISLKAVWSDVRKQVSLLWEGKDSDYAWLNTLRDGFLQVKKFAMDAWAVVSGGNASNFAWLNTARDQVVAFARRLGDAFDMLKDLMRGIGEVIKPILQYFDTDVLTFGLFVGLARMTGILGGIATAVGLVTKAFGGLFALGGGAVAAGKAVAGVTGAAGAATATAAGLTSSLVTVGSTMSLLIKSAAVLGTSIAGGFALGQKAAQWWMKDTMAAYEKVWEAQEQLNRAQEKPYINALLKRQDDRGRVFARDYWGKEGIDIGRAGMTVAERYLADKQDSDVRIWGRARFSGKDAEARYRDDEEATKWISERHNAVEQKRQQPAAVFRYDIKINGQSATATGDLSFKRTLDELNNGFS